MAEFKDMLKYYRKREGLSQAGLAEKLGLAASTISMYEIGQRTPDFETEELIADFFNVDLNTLRGRDVEKENATASIRIPIYGSVAAGLPIGESECILGYEEIPSAWYGDFAALEVVGDSMDPFIKNGDILIIKMQSVANSGDIVVARVNSEEFTVKKLIKSKDSVILQPLNPIYEPIVFSAESEDILHIWGKVVQIRRNL